MSGLTPQQIKAATFMGMALAESLYKSAFAEAGLGRVGDDIKAMSARVQDSALRAEAIGIDVKRVHWLGFAIAGGICGIAGGLFAFAKGSISPETIHVGRSIDGLVMVLLGGIQTLTGPIVGASVFATLQDTVMRQTEYWRALLGIIILILVLAFPQGIVGAFSAMWRRAGAKP